MSIKNSYIQENIDNSSVFMWVKQFINLNNIFNNIIIHLNIYP